MMIFHTDLDNTLIYSYKREIGPCKKCVELYQGREVSFMTEYSYEKLREVNRNLCLVPTTTRSVEQYQRIDLGLGRLRYALAANGGVLLLDGQSDERWYRESLELAAKSSQELDLGYDVLKKDEHRSFEIRKIHELFLFTKSSDPEQTVRRLRGSLDETKVDVFHNGIKVYVIPKEINKGTAVRRFQERFKTGPVIAAGDSEFDIPMLREADVALAPKELGKLLRQMEPESEEQLTLIPGIKLGSGKRVFSDELLDDVAELVKRQMKPEK